MTNFSADSGFRGTPLDLVNALAELVGIIVNDLTNSFFAELAVGVDMIVQGAGFVQFMGHSAEDVQRVNGASSCLLWAPNVEGSRPWSDKLGGQERLAQQQVKERAAADRVPGLARQAEAAAVIEAGGAGEADVLCTDRDAHYIAHPAGHAPYRGALEPPPWVVEVEADRMPPEVGEGGAEPEAG